MNYKLNHMRRPTKTSAASADAGEAPVSPTSDLTMSPDRLPPAPGPADRQIDAYATELDVQTALALARANSRAMRSLSPDSHRQIVAAVSDEIRMQETLDSPTSRLVATLLKGHLAELS